MSISTEEMLAWCETLLNNDQTANLSLTQYLQAIPRLESLDDVPAGTPVLIRGDVDAKPGEKIGQGDIRLRSMVETLKYGKQRGWKLIIFGHLGRKPEGSLDKVAQRLGELLETEALLIEDWLDEETLDIYDSVKQQIDQAAEGSLIVLQNSRKYEIERALWKATKDDLPKLAERFAKLANQFAEKIATVYINEALSAGSLDASSTIIPAAMQQCVLGKYCASEFEGPMLDCMQAELVVFSGLKIDKLDDLEAIINRGKVEMVLTAGSLAMALIKATANLAGEDVCLGVAENPEHRDKPYYIPPQRIQQAQEMVRQGQEKGIQFILPIDFILADGNPADSLSATDQQFDVGPKTNDLFAAEVGKFIDSAASRGAVAFHNGVFGMFEDPRFEEGTRRFVGQLKRMKDSGIRVYVGGGEGGKSLERYGEADWVTHCFTAGGTVLNALGSDPVPYLIALWLANR